MTDTLREVLDRLSMKGAFDVHKDGPEGWQAVGINYAVHEINKVLAAREDGLREAAQDLVDIMAKPSDGATVYQAVLRLRAALAAREDARSPEAPALVDWKEEARRYAGNADYWRGMYETCRAASQPVTEERSLQATLADHAADSNAEQGYHDHCGRRCVPDLVARGVVLAASDMSASQPVTEETT